MKYDTELNIAIGTSIAILFVLIFLLYWSLDGFII